MKKEVRAQAALEFLTTYAWALLGILVTIGALYYFGIFDFAKFLPQECIFPSQFECIDFSFVGDPDYGQANDQIRFRLVNNIGEKIRVTDIDVTNDAESPLTCNLASPAMPFEWEEGIEEDFVLDDCQDGIFMTGERTEARITIIYCAPATTGCPAHALEGKITAVVNAP